MIFSRLFCRNLIVNEQIFKVLPQCAKLFFTLWKAARANLAAKYKLFNILAAVSGALLMIFSYFSTKTLCFGGVIETVLLSTQNLFLGLIETVLLSTQNIC